MTAGAVAEKFLRPKGGSWPNGPSPPMYATECKHEHPKNAFSTRQQHKKIQGSSDAYICSLTGQDLSDKAHPGSSSDKSAYFL